MDIDPDISFRILIAAKNHYGRLNIALVGEYLRKNGSTSVNQIAQDVGLSRTAVTKAIQELSEKDMLPEN